MSTERDLPSDKEDKAKRGCVSLFGGGGEEEGEEGEEGEKDEEEKELVMKDKEEEEDDEDVEEEGEDEEEDDTSQEFEAIRAITSSKNPMSPPSDPDQPHPNSMDMQQRLLQLLKAAKGENAVPPLPGQPPPNRPDRQDYLIELLKARRANNPGTLVFTKPVVSRMDQQQRISEFMLLHEAKFRLPPMDFGDTIEQQDGTCEKADYFDELPFSEKYRDESEQLMDLLPGWYELNRPEHMRYFDTSGEELQVKTVLPKSAKTMDSAKSTGSRKCAESNGMLKVRKRKCSLGVPEEELLVIYDYPVHFMDVRKRVYRNAFVMRYINKDWSCWNVGDESTGWPTADKAHDCRFEVETEINGRWQLAHLMTRADQRKERVRARYQSWRRDFYFLFGPESIPESVLEGWLIYTWPSTQEMPEAAVSHPERSRDEIIPISGRFNRGDECNGSGAEYFEEEEYKIDGVL